MSTRQTTKIISFQATKVVELLALSLKGEVFHKRYVDWKLGQMPETGFREPSLWLVFDDEVFLMTNNGHGGRMRPINSFKSAESDIGVAITINSGALLDLLKLSHKFVDFHVSEDKVTICASTGFNVGSLQYS